MGNLNLNLKELRELNNITQETLAQKIGVTRQHIGMIENNITKPSIPVAKKIAKTLGFDWTLFYQDEEADDVHATRTCDTKQVG